MKKQKIKCKNCGHLWETKSERMFVTCSNCLSKVKNFPIKKLKKGVKNKTAKNFG